MRLYDAKKENLGRSLVEMLGVLAVIGCLTIGGLSGYKFAMDYYQANGIANEINLMRTDAKVKIGQGAEILALGAPYDQETANSLSGGKGVINFNAYAVEYDCLLDDELMDNCQMANGYHFTLSAIPKGICKPLSNLLNGMKGRRVVEVNDAVYTDASVCDEDENKVAVFFDTTPFTGGQTDGGDDDGECLDDYDCDGYCVSGQCVECKTSADCDGRVCDQEYGACADCEDDSDCTNGYHCRDNGVCAECTKNEHCETGHCTKWNTCGICSNDSDCDSGLHCASSGSCVECRDMNDCPTDKPACDPVTHTCALCKTDDDCGGTMYDHCITDGAKTGQCVKCSENSPLYDGGVCSSCPSCTRWNETTRACESVAGQEEQCCRDDLSCDAGLYCLTNSERCEKDASFGVCKQPLIAAQGMINGMNMVVSDGEMNFWSGKRFCEALNMSMATQEDVHITFNEAHGGYGWDSATVAAVKALQEKVPDYTWAWLDYEFDDNCRSHGIYLEYGSGGYSNRNSKWPTLCK